MFWGILRKEEEQKDSEFGKEENRKSIFVQWYTGRKQEKKDIYSSPVIPWHNFIISVTIQYTVALIWVETQSYHTTQNIHKHKVYIMTVFNEFFFLFEEGGEAARNKERNG